MKPQLHTASEVGLLATDAGVVVEVIDRSHYVELLIDRDGRRHIAAEAVNVAIHAAEHLATHRDATVAIIVGASLLRLPLARHSPAVLTVGLTLLGIIII